MTGNTNICLIKINNRKISPNCLSPLHKAKRFREAKLVQRWNLIDFGLETIGIAEHLDNLENSTNTKN